MATKRVTVCLTGRLATEFAKYSEAERAKTSGPARVTDHGAAVYLLRRGLEVVQQQAKKEKK